MMARSGSKHPTELELQILKVHWRTSPLPVRDVRARLETDAGRVLSHSSVITILNIMVRKGYLRRKKEGITPARILTMARLSPRLAAQSGV
jgi:predicted transcriptional regulator